MLHPCCGIVAGRQPASQPAAPPPSYPRPPHLPPSRVAAGMATDAFEEFVVGHGELWCAQLTAARCRQLGADCVFLDARDVLVVTPTADGNSVDVQYEVRYAVQGGERHV